MIDLERASLAAPAESPVPPFPPIPPAVFAPPRRKTQRWRVLLALLVVVLAGLWIIVALRSGTDGTTAPTPTAESIGVPRLIARGQVRPIAQARVGTLAGGVVTQLGVEVGDSVAEQREIARVRGSDGQIEVLTAPWRGTVTGIPVHVGDTVTPGTIVATLGDLSRLQVETTDVDEFLIGYLSPGQGVTLIVDALDRRLFDGYVRTVSLQVQKNSSDDDHYPIVIDFVGSTASLRPGMTARVTFQQGSP
jgi:multidrug efflux pump subunit AcrA (membrane-fusion protein)